MAGSLNVENRDYRARVASALAVALACHATLAGVLIALVGPRAAQRVSDHGAQAREAPAIQGIIWFAGSSIARGGGGGGNHSPEPARPAALPGRDRTTVPVAKQRNLNPSRVFDFPDALQQLAIDARRQASSDTILAGVLEPSIHQVAWSQGPGDDGGAGPGDGIGVGDGRGPGLDKGDNGGTGGGQRHDPNENGVIAPQAIRIEKPRYTTQAMSAHIQGSVLVECVVEPDGSCDDARIVRSLDRIFGLDQEAVKATEQWRFRPGTLFGRAVPVIVRIELQFAIR